MHLLKMCIKEGIREQNECYTHVNLLNLLVLYTIKDKFRLAKTNTVRRPRINGFPIYLQISEAGTSSPRYVETLNQNAKLTIL